MNLGARGFRINPAPARSAGRVQFKRNGALAESAVACHFPGMEWRTTGRPAKRPVIIEPCIPTRVSKPPVGPQWIRQHARERRSRSRHGGSPTRRGMGTIELGAFSLPQADGMAPVAAGSWYLMRCADVGALGAVSVAPVERL
jgi:hypothetical protein